MTISGVTGSLSSVCCKNTGPLASGREGLTDPKEGDATLWSAQTVGFMGTAKDPEKVIEESQDAGGPFADLSIWQRELLAFPYTYSSALLTMKVRRA